MKTILKKFIFFILALLIFASFSFSALAEEYNVFGGQFVYISNGVEINHSMTGVTCNNRVNSDQYPIIHQAIDNAIADWNWHLSVLNSWKDTSYSLLNVQQTSADPRCLIEFTVAPNDPYFEYGRHAQARTYYLNENEIDITNKVVANGSNWCYVRIDFHLLELEAGGYDTVEEIQRIANHELGHAFGLAHDHSDPGIIMYGEETDDVQISLDAWTATVPTEHDLLAFYSIYG